jgi:hypothetical protein
LVELSQVVERIKGDTAAAVWCELADNAMRMGGTVAADTVIGAMAASDDNLLRLEAHAQMIRVYACDRFLSHPTERF